MGQLPVTVLHWLQLVNFGRLFILVLGLPMYYTLPIVCGLTSKRRTLLLCVILWQIWTLISSNHQEGFRVFVPTPLAKVM
jgi:hypothetical protein